MLTKMKKLIISIYSKTFTLLLLLPLNENVKIFAKNAPLQVETKTPTFRNNLINNKITNE